MSRKCKYVLKHYPACTQFFNVFTYNFVSSETLQVLMFVCTAVLDLSFFGSFHPWSKAKLFYNKSQYVCRSVTFSFSCWKIISTDYNFALKRPGFFLCGMFFKVYVSKSKILFFYSWKDYILVFKKSFSINSKPRSLKTNPNLLYSTIGNFHSLLNMFLKGFFDILIFLIADFHILFLEILSKALSYEKIILAWPYPNYIFNFKLYTYFASDF